MPQSPCVSATGKSSVHPNAPPGPAPLQIAPIILQRCSVKKGVFRADARMLPPAAPCWKHPGLCSYLCLFLLSSIDDGSAADFGDLPPLPVERPAADLISNHILYEEHSPIKPQGQLVKQLYVLQHVVIGVAARDEGRRCQGNEGSTQNTMGFRQ